MLDIWLISPNPALNQAIQLQLPSPLHLVHFASVERAKNCLGTIGREQIPAVILLDSPSLEDSLQELLSDRVLQSIPLIGILSRIEQRQACLAAGADDFILLPLEPSELLLRLETHLQAAQTRQEILVQIINALDNELISFSSPGLRRLADIFKARGAWIGLIPPKQKTIALVQSSRISMEERDEFTKIALNLLPQPSEPSVQITAIESSKNGVESFFLTAPILEDGWLQAVIGFTFSEPPALSRYEQRVLADLSHELSKLLSIHFTQRETLAYIHQYGLLVLVTRMISEEIPLEQFINRLLQQIQNNLDIKRIELWLMHDDPNRLDLVGSASLICDRIVDQMHISSGILGKAFHTRQTIRLDSASQAAFFDSAKDHLENLNDYSILAIPIQRPDAVLGVLAIIDGPDKHPDNQEVILLETITNLLALYFANLKTVQELRQSRAIQVHLLQQNSGLISWHD